MINGSQTHSETRAVNEGSRLHRFLILQALVGFFHLGEGRGLSSGTVKVSRRFVDDASETLRSGQHQSEYVPTAGLGHTSLYTLVLQKVPSEGL